jgi:hypothetical protein
VAPALRNRRFPGARSSNRETMKGSRYGNVFTDIATWFYIWKLFPGGSMQSTHSWASH